MFTKGNAITWAMTNQKQSPKAVKKMEVFFLVYET